MHKVFYYLEKSSSRIESDVISSSIKSSRNVNLYHFSVLSTHTSYSHSQRTDALAQTLNIDLKIDT